MLLIKVQIGAHLEGKSMRKKIMASILSAVLALSMGTPVSLVGAEEFVSEETAAGLEEDKKTEETETTGQTGIETAEPAAAAEITEPAEPAEPSEDADGGDEAAFGDDVEDVQDEGSPEVEDAETEENAVQDVLFSDGDAEGDLSVEEIESETAATDLLDANNSGFDTASAISVNTTYSTNFSGNYKEKYYKITVPARGSLSVNFMHEYLEANTCYWKMKIYNSGNHEEIASYEFAGNKISYSQERFGLDAGTYYIKIYNDYLWSAITFKFLLKYEASNSWETEYNDTYQLADSIDVNTQYYGSRQRNGDIDWYKFVVPQNGYISLNFTHGYIESSEEYWEMDLYDAGYSELEEYSSPGTEVASGDYRIGVPAGTYYLKIHNDFWYSTLEYGLKVNYKASAVWEKEINNDYKTATSISLNTTYYGSIQDGIDNDADWYTFTSPGAGSYELTFAHSYIESNYAYWKVQIYNSSFNSEFSVDYRGNVQTKSDKVTLSGAGTYYIKITEGYDSALITYSFSLASHKHQYTYTGTKATLSKDGAIIGTCSCGYVGKRTTIYSPAKISLAASSYTYDGKSHKPKVTVYDRKGKVISTNYYQVSYSSNTKSIGAHYVTVKFKGYYSGTTSKKYVINPKATKLTGLSAKSKGFTAKWRKGSSCTGYQVQYSTSKTFSRKKTVAVPGRAKTSVRIKRLTGSKRYYVRVRTYSRVSGKVYYSSWSSARAVKTKR